MAPVVENFYLYENSIMKSPTLIEQIHRRLVSETPKFFKFIAWIGGALMAMSLSYIGAKQLAIDLNLPKAMDDFFNWGMFLGSFLSALAAKMVVKDPNDLERTVRQIKRQKEIRNQL